MKNVLAAISYRHSAFFILTFSLYLKNTGLATARVTRPVLLLAVRIAFKGDPYASWVAAGTTFVDGWAARRLNSAATTSLALTEIVQRPPPFY